MKIAQGVESVSVGTRQDLLRLTAQWVSQIGSPPLLTLAGAAFLFSAGSIAWIWFGVFALCTVVMPMAYVVWLLHRGDIGDMHMKHRAERMKPLVFTCVGNLVGVGALWWGGEASQLLSFAVVQCVIAAAFLAITPWFKISLHSASAGVMFLLSVSLAGHVFAPLFTLLLICWSRLFLRRHTPVQVLAGCALSGLVWVSIW